MSKRVVRIFVCYSHRDRWFLKERSAMAANLESLTDRGATLWWDKSLRAGDLWNKEIRRQLNEAHIAMCLISPYFLTSVYIRNIEARRIRERRSTSGLRIVPIFLSTCHWREHRWLLATQGLPTDDKYVRPHYSNRMEVICYDIRQHLLSHIREILSTTTATSKKRAKGPAHVGKRRQERWLYVLRRKQYDDLTASEYDRLLKDSKERARAVEPRAGLREDICKAAVTLIKRNGGRALRKPELEALDKRFLLEDRSRKADAYRLRWILRACELHPQAKDSASKWRL
jgi:TIR domain